MINNIFKSTVEAWKVIFVDLGGFLIQNNFLVTLE